MSEPERKLFADGFASQLATKINETSDRRSVLNSVFNSPSARQRVEMALGKDKAQEFEAFMHIEGLMDRLKNAVTGNSSTVRQLTEAGLAGGLAGGIYGDGNTTDISIGAAMGALARKGKIKIDARLAQRVGEMLSSSDPEVSKGLSDWRRKTGLLWMQSRKLTSSSELEHIRSLDRRRNPHCRP